MNIIAQYSPIILFVFLVAGFGFMLYRIGQLQQLIEDERRQFGEDMKEEQAKCNQKISLHKMESDKKISLLEYKIQTLTHQIIDILQNHKIPTGGISLSVDAGGDVDIAEVSGGSNRERNVPVTRRGL